MSTRVETGLNLSQTNHAAGRLSQRLGLISLFTIPYYMGRLEYTDRSIEAGKIPYCSVRPSMETRSSPLLLLHFFSSSSFLLLFFSFLALLLVFSSSLHPVTLYPSELTSHSPSFLHLGFRLASTSLSVIENDLQLSLQDATHQQVLRCSSGGPGGPG